MLSFQSPWCCERVNLPFQLKRTKLPPYFLFLNKMCPIKKGPKCPGLSCILCTCTEPGTVRSLGQPGRLTLDKFQHLTGHMFYLDPHSRLRQVCRLQLRYNFPSSYSVFSPRFASAQPSSPPGFCWSLPSPPPSNLPCMSLCPGPQGSQRS